ncbi:MAG TPA: transcription antitermination factor NusB [Opitutae bacterium]|nr:transcription antitermination factor NusB [Opitutaceae bacterium]HCR29519.1 transcription antitermination factor NusB [Opitutae bacterium]
MAEQKKSQRRQCRIACMQYLYSWSLNEPSDLNDDLRVFYEGQEEERDYYAFADELIFGVIENVESIDGKIQEIASNWDFGRIAKIDLSILRMAIYELLFRKDIPPVVTINEAIDLSKQYSAEESRRFVNGVLDRLRGQLNRPSRQASWE